jgi:iron complex outermembrane receptor protein
VSLYGKNLLNDVKHGGDTQLPATLGPPAIAFPLGGTFSPLSKGRIVGIELGYKL